jgi:hypothetical protein
MIGLDILSGMAKSTGQPSRVKASIGTRLMVLKGGRRLHAGADATHRDD